MGFGSIVIQLIFAYFATMTVWHHLKCGLSDPGYVDEMYKHPLYHNKMAPQRELRLLNLEHFERNKLFDFDNLDPI